MVAVRSTPVPIRPAVMVVDLVAILTRMLATQAEDPATREITAGPLPDREETHQSAQMAPLLGQAVAMEPPLAVEGPVNLENLEKIPVREFLAPQGLVHLAPARTAPVPMAAALVIKALPVPLVLRATPEMTAKTEVMVTPAATAKTDRSSNPPAPRPSLASSARPDPPAPPERWAPVAPGDPREERERMERMERRESLEWLDLQASKAVLATQDPRDRPVPLAASSAYPASAARPAQLAPPDPKANRARPDPTARRWTDSLARRATTETPDRRARKAPPDRPDHLAPPVRRVPATTAPRPDCPMDIKIFILFFYTFGAQFFNNPSFSFKTTLVVDRK